MLRKYQGYLIDLDGTMYKGTERIPEAAEFVRKLHKLNIPYLLSPIIPPALPNKWRKSCVLFHSRRSGSHYVQPTANYIYEKKPDASVYMIGEEGLKTALDEKDSGTARNMSIMSFSALTGKLLRETGNRLFGRPNEATFISTNADIALPPNGFMPGTVLDPSSPFRRKRNRFISASRSRSSWNRH